MIKGESKKDRKGQSSYNIQVLTFLSGRHEILPKENLYIHSGKSLPFVETMKY